MKTANVLIAMTLFFTTNAFAKMVAISEGASVRLKGTIAAMYRPNTNGDEAEVIKKCGKSYTALVLNEPVKMEVTDLESGAKSAVQIYRFAIHQGTKISKGLDAVSGVIQEDLAGSCNTEEFGIY
ncbi:MAG: hypothetical protein ACKOX6_12725 [Bdellovibrio sp.]